MADQPGANDARANKVLTNLSIGYANTVYIAGQIFPTVLVNERSDIIPKYTKSAWFRDEAKELSEMEAPPLSGYGVDITDTYYCREYGIGHPISDQRKANTALPFDAYRDGTRWLTDKLAMKEERLFVTDFWKTGVWTTDKAGTSDFTKWSTYATSTPIQDLRTFIRLIRRGLGGIMANTLVLGDLVYDTLADHPNILDRVKYGQMAGSPAMVTPNLIAQLLGLKRVLVGMSMYTADVEGTAEGSVTYTPNWDDDGLLLYVAPRPSLFNPSAGYNFTWRTAFGGPRYVKVRRHPESDKGDLLEGFQFMDQKVTAADAGLFIGDAVD